MFGKCEGIGGYVHAVYSYSVIKQPEHAPIVLFISTSIHFNPKYLYMVYLYKNEMKNKTYK